MRTVGLTQRVEVVPGRGERRDALDQAWARLLEDLSLRSVPVPNGLANPVGWCEEVGLSGLVLTGGNDLAHLPGASTPAPERDATERALLDWSVRIGIPVLGVCRGLQVMHHRLGGRLRPVEAHAGRRHGVRPRVLVPACGEPGEVNSFHDWGLDPEGWPESLIPELEATDGTVEAVRHRSLPWVGIMWHPERESPARPHDLRLLTDLFATGKR